MEERDVDVKTDEMIERDGLKAVDTFRSGNEERALHLAVTALNHGYPRGVYEVAMEYFWENDLLKCIAYNKLCLKHAPDWTYAFLAKYNVAVCYERLGFWKRARIWAKLSLVDYPTFAAAKTLACSCGASIP